MTERFPIEGWAAIYNAADLNGDVIAPGAFRRSLARSGPDAVKLLYQHAADRPVGLWRRFEERSSGLYAYGDLFLATQTAREVEALIRARIIDGLSIGYQTVRSEKAGAARRIVEADLWEVSIVTFPMAPNARLVRVGDPDDQPILAFADSVREAANILSA